MSKQQKKLVDTEKENALAEAKADDEIIEKLINCYDKTAEHLQSEIQRIVYKFAEDNELTTQQATELLKGKEYDRWRMSIQEYLKEIETSEDPKLLLELNTLSAKSRITRKEQLISQIDMEMGKLADQSNKIIKKHLEKVLVEHYYRGHYAVQKALGVGWKVGKFNPDMIKKIIEYPWETKTFSKAIWEDIDKLTTTLRKELANGMIAGHSVDKMASAINKVMDKGMYNAKRLVRTESTYFTQQAQAMSYQKMGFKKYMFVGDGCPDCAAVNGKIFTFEEAEPGVNMPPMHPNCKCRIIAQGDLSMFDYEKRGKITPLHENVKYQQWKEKFVKANKKR